MGQVRQPVGEWGTCPRGGGMGGGKAGEGGGENQRGEGRTKAGMEDMGEGGMD